MRLLLDENLPRKLKYRFDDDYEVLTVTDLGWSGKKNGDLLKSMQQKDLTILITGDKNMGYQHSIRQYNITLLVLDSKDMRYESLLAFVPAVEKYLSKEIEPGIQLIQLEE